MTSEKRAAENVKFLKSNELLHKNNVIYNVTNNRRNANFPPLFKFHFLV
jgi:hypothetical protein